jgi:hypothetical protein
VKIFHTQNNNKIPLRASKLRVWTLETRLHKTLMQLL